MRKDPNPSRKPLTPDEYIRRLKAYRLANTDVKLAAEILDMDYDRLVGWLRFNREKLGIEIWR